MSKGSRADTQQRVSLNTFGDNVTVLSPHLDDAILSLGAAISQATHSGTRVRIVTVLAGDPEAELPLGKWDSLTGFASAREATRSRRLEDEKACALVGAEPVWLPFPDNEHGGPPDAEEVTSVLDSALGRTDAVLVPGFPLSHPDHEWLASLARNLEFEPRRVIHYLEQPYAIFDWDRSIPPRIGCSRWFPLHAGRIDKLAKLRACKSYRSQVPALGGWELLARTTIRELRLGGELVLAHL